MLSDEQLVQFMAQGNQAAFEAFVYRYHGLLLGYLERMLQDHKKAEDLVQEVFIRLIRQLQQNKPPDKIKPWLYRVALNLCRDYWKSVSYRSEQYQAELPEQLDFQQSVIEIYEHQETRKEVLRLLRSLPQIQREIIILRFFQDLKLQEIADVLHLNLSTTKTHLYKALKRLKQELLEVESEKQREEGHDHEWRVTGTGGTRRVRR